MKSLLKLEGVGLLILYVVTYYFLDFSWGYFALLFFVPDLGFLGYLINPKIGAVTYNILHHQGLLGIVLGLGILTTSDIILETALIFLAHSAFDRIFGYGLKYNDSFHHTHLGWIGKNSDQRGHE
ncbi:DUF4260 domain-containing protein [Robertkochia solimangrovi]|uniref:DUF4260 domain-containing protein n=1 Tax=Robertkochia solimangrovi TaxID=2213046 RepID=UPI00117CBF71|nr:DUF4260 domain-containing protein [Robertkochia solimangrovi]TRZ46467.1 DUF4260 domain-containing protein [Robertkochia solimangrovi]